MSSPAMFIPREFKSRLKHVKEDFEAARQRSSLLPVACFFMCLTFCYIWFVKLTAVLLPFCCHPLCTRNLVSSCALRGSPFVSPIPPVTPTKCPLDGWSLGNHTGLIPRSSFPEAALSVAQDSHRDVCSREQRRSKRSSCVNLLLAMRSAIISENMQLVAGDFNSGAGATPGGLPELCGSLKQPHSHCWKITNMVPGVSTWPWGPRGRLRVPACLGKIAVLDITRFCKSITYDASWSGLLECQWCTFLGPFGTRIGEVRLQPLQRVDNWYLRRRVLLLQSTCGYKLTKDGTEFFPPVRNFDECKICRVNSRLSNATLDHFDGLGTSSIIKAMFTTQYVGRGWQSMHCTEWWAQVAMTILITICSCRQMLRKTRKRLREAAPAMTRSAWKDWPLDFHPTRHQSASWRLPLKCNLLETNLITRVVVLPSRRSWYPHSFIIGMSTDPFRAGAAVTGIPTFCENDFLRLISSIADCHLLISPRMLRCMRLLRFRWLVRFSRLLLVRMGSQWKLVWVSFGYQRLLPDLRAGCPPAVSSVSIREIIASFICIGIVMTSIAMKIVMCCVEVVWCASPFAKIKQLRSKQI